MTFFYELRKIFFDFFKSKGHIIVPSSSLIPLDSSVLLTTAGMQQFKKYYTGELNAISDFNSLRVISIQKCFRTSDIDEVGDKTHLTFFEMMGNFSFSPIGNDNPNNLSSKVGYFKKSSIRWSWEFITKILNINQDRIFVTVFGGDKYIKKDDESYEIWKNDIGLPENRIKIGNRKDNFWGPTGNEGPCGPTTEIYVSYTEGDAINGNGVEIWNIVFNEYYAKQNKFNNLEYVKSKNPGIDTGMGFERLLSVLEGKDNVFMTSSFKKIIKEIEKNNLNLDEKAKRVLADHIRASVFLISDGVLPSNKEAGYILRRLLRRIIGISIKYNFSGNIFKDVYKVIVKQYGEIYPKIKNENEIINIWNNEFNKFRNAIEKGINELKKIKSISGEKAFYLYETFGLPLDLIREFTDNSLIKGNIEKGFNIEMEKHKKLSRAGAEKKFGGHGLLLDTGELKAGDNYEVNRVIKMHTATHLLQWALRRVLGNEIKQMGSDINPKRLRFDFSFDRKLTENELKSVENLVNEKIKENLDVYYKEMDKNEAFKIGALSFFKEKYPDVVKVYFIGHKGNDDIAISKEFCGGPHVLHTKDIGKFKILKQESIGRNVKRIRAYVI